LIHFRINPNTLAPEYPESAFTRPFPFNGYYSQDEAPDVDGETYQLEIGGLVDNKKPWTLPELYKLPEVSQITRHVCVEGWSAIGSWQGVRLSDFLKMIGAARQVRLVQVRGRIFEHDRHADRAAPADAAYAQVRSPASAAHIRLSDQNPHPDQTRLQEPEIRDRHVGAEQ
jgi:DMSO/TMAO reductase YedYZ molybdopterin-dependent catalytic subunit